MCVCVCVCLCETDRVAVFMLRHSRGRCPQQLSSRQLTGDTVDTVETVCSREILDKFSMRSVLQQI